MTYEHSLFTLRETCDLCCYLILGWADMWLGCAKFKSKCTNISSGVNYTNKKILSINFFKKKFKSGGSIEPPEYKLTPPMSDWCKILVY